MTSFAQNATAVLADLRVPAVMNYIRETFLTAMVVRRFNGSTVQGGVMGRREEGKTRGGKGG